MFSQVSDIIQAYIICVIVTNLFLPCNVATWLLSCLINKLQKTLAVYHASKKVTVGTVGRVARIYAVYIATVICTVEMWSRSRLIELFPSSSIIDQHESDRSRLRRAPNCLSLTCPVGVCGSRVCPPAQKRTDLSSFNTAALPLHDGRTDRRTDGRASGRLTAIACRLPVSPAPERRRRRSNCQLFDCYVASRRRPTDKQPLLARHHLRSSSRSQLLQPHTWFCSL